MSAAKSINKMVRVANKDLRALHSVSVQDWVEGVYISLSAVKLHKGANEYIWHIGKPQNGEYLHATNNTHEAIGILEEIIMQDKLTAFLDTLVWAPEALTSEWVFARMWEFDTFLGYSVLTQEVRNALKAWAAENAPFNLGESEIVNVVTSFIATPSWVVEHTRDTDFATMREVVAGLLGLIDSRNNADTLAEAALEALSLAVWVKGENDNEFSFMDVSQARRFAGEVYTARWTPKDGVHQEDDTVSAEIIARYANEQYDEEEYLGKSTMEKIRNQKLMCDE